jgi:hypothetical protein
VCVSTLIQLCASVCFVVIFDSNHFFIALQGLIFCQKQIIGRIVILHIEGLAFMSRQYQLLYKAITIIYVEICLNLLSLHNMQTVYKTCILLY